jgi:glucosamine--fructose-6-phosphate aminotransferase (isomerizing)
MTHMAEEIAESGAAAARCLSENAVVFAALGERLRASDPTVVVTNARGSSDHCALYLKYLVEIRLGLPCASIGPSIASLYRAPLALSRALAVSISQSGRSPDILAAQAAARVGGALTLAFVNEASSPLATEAEALVRLSAGEERSVAATKSMIAGLVAGAALVASWGGDEAMGAALKLLPAKLGAPRPAPAALVEAIARSPSAFVLGRGSTFAIAAEAALKLKETCAIHAEAFSAAEVMHGPAEIVRPGFLLLAFRPSDEAAQGFDAALQRFAALGARVVVVEAGAEDGQGRLGAEDAGHPLLAPITMVHRFYALAEAAARSLGRDPDRPANLRKVTETR